MIFKIDDTYTMDESKITQRIKSTLKELGLRQIHLADKLGVKPQSLSRALNEGISTSKYFPKIAELLDVSLEYLLTGTERKVIFVDDIKLKKLVASEFSPESINECSKHDLLLKTNLNGIFFACELKVPLDDTFKAGSIIIYSTSFSLDFVENKIYIILSSMSQSTIVGRYSKEKHELKNKFGSYPIQKNDNIIGMGVEYLIYEI